jgi:hypothetical protein
MPQAIGNPGQAIGGDSTCDTRMALVWEKCRRKLRPTRLSNLPKEH